MVTRVDCEIGKEGALYFKDMLISKPMKFLQELDISGMILFSNEPIRECYYR